MKGWEPTARVRGLGAMVKAENKGTYKHTGPESNQVCDIDLYKNIPTSQNNSFANGQYRGSPAITFHQT